MKPTNHMSWFFNQSQGIRFSIILAMIFIIAFINYLTSPQFSIRLFYLIPLFLSVWDGNGIIPGLLFSFMCTCVYFLRESLQGNIRWHGFYLLWEITIVCFNFMAFVVIVDKLKKSNTSILQKKKELEIINNQKDKFFSIIAHDLRSPFQGFLGITKIMAEETSNYTAQELANLSKEMHQVANNLYNLLKNLLEWAQMQRDTINFQPEEFSVSDMIAENIRVMKERCEQKGIKIINNATTPIQVYADPKEINSVLLNLISNAIKFTKRDGRITIDSKETDDQMIEISVSDTGIGMEKIIVDKLFKVGEKVNSLGTEGELSTGLGLLLCKEFVEKHGGRIWAVSEEGKGTTMSFNIPAK